MQQHRKSLQKKILIVSLYGRGDWLALECQKNGLDAALLDLTPLIQRSTEDMEGPFGVFASKKHTLSQMTRLTDEGPLVLSDRGYTFWLKNGPLEFKGPLSLLQIKKAKIPDILLNYLHLADDPSSDLSDISLQVEQLPFQQNWLAHLAHQISASVFMENHKGLDFGSPLPLLSSFYYRKFHKRGKSSTQQSLSECTVLVAVKKPLQLFTNSALLEGIQYEEGKQIQAQQIVWMLSSEESTFCLDKAAQRLFPKGQITPQWYWSHYRMDLGKSDIPEFLPDHFVMIEDTSLPWTHDNLSIVQKTLRKGIMDVWIRLPSSQRFQKDYVKNYGQILCQHFKNRMALTPNIQDWPTEVLEDTHFPTFFGVYDLKDRLSLKRADLKNVIFEGPEVWTALGWDGQFRSNRRTLKQILQSLEL